jgi:hypothetical protein
MQEYPSGKGYKYGFTLLSAAMAGLSVWIILNSQGDPRTLVGGLLMLGFFTIILVPILRYKIILGEDFIERVYFSRRKIFFRDIIQVIIENQQAYVVSREARLHISQEISDRSQLLQILIGRLKNFPYVQLTGDPFVISHLLDAKEHNPEMKENLGAGKLESYAGTVSARLIGKRWLYREFDVRTPRGGYTVIYYGRGLGYECVLVNDEVVDKKDSYFWYVPEFRFKIDDLPAVIKVRVWPWLILRSFILEVGGKEVYHEGS